MKQEEILKIVGIIIVSFIIIYSVIKIFELNPKMKEGMSNNSDGSVGSSGEAGTSASYSAAIKSEVVKLQDELLISKYRKEYESVIINLDDYVGYLMLKQILNIKLNNDPKEIIQYINNLNILKSAKDSLNTAMSFLDKQ